MEAIHLTSEYLIQDKRDIVNPDNSIKEENVELTLTIDFLSKKTTLKPLHGETFIFKNVSNINFDVHILETMIDSLLFAHKLLSDNLSSINTNQIK